MFSAHTASSPDGLYKRGFHETNRSSLKIILWRLWLIHAISLGSSHVDEQPVAHEVDNEIALCEHACRYDCGRTRAQRKGLEDREVGDRERFVMPFDSSRRHGLGLEHGNLSRAFYDADDGFVDLSPIRDRRRAKTLRGMPVENIQTRTKIENGTDLTARNADIEK